ncbi:hypothetical protein VP1G_01791 [Cytospora mali]|uniref:Heparan-alpha-glucosaminide N-acetyltransferase catalytic domain-containing protein n=1 Tax=Cytospora mali TaxID=578113 RepID=A0A194URQ3_CYTMA|nr:hypothetical protein VP1G_01791 [Valsa mali var. pyri (nom. inval.)]
MEEAVRALPGNAVQETSFEDDAPTHDDHVRTKTPELGSASNHNTTTTVHGHHHGTTHMTYGSVSDDEVESSLHITTSTKSTTRGLAPDLLRGLLMVLMALDHNTLALNPWEPETAIDGEVDSGEPVHEWNRPVAYAVRSLTHLCAPGFIFLLCAGTVYFSRSRKAIGWSSWRMTWHFLQRAVLLTLLCVPLGLVLTLGKAWFLNLVLFALAVDYLVAGLLFLVISKTEESLAFGLLRVLPDAKGDDAREPLLADRRGEEDIAPDLKIMRAADISWHVHNALLLALAVVTVWWNIWLSPSGGHCKVDSSVADLAVVGLPKSNWFRVWFYPFKADGVVSELPPLAWLSFAFLGLLYGRVVLARPWTKTALTIGNTLTGIAFSVVFVLTRVLQFGNLPNGCLHLPKGPAHPDANPYLSSWSSFFYVVKYPPDVAFWAYSLGSNFVLLVFLGIIPVAVALTLLNPLLVYGTSALFFYVVHLVLLFLSRLVWLPLMGHDMGWKDRWTGEGAVGVDKMWVYWLNWALVLVVMYPLCRWYGSFKKTRGPDSIWRFF